MVILGIDPGYATTGFGVVFSDRGNLKLLNYGTITTPTTLTFPQRLEVLYDDMEELLKTVKPEAVAVEELFVNIAHYAYSPGTGSATIGVEILKDPAAIAITFTDRGKPFDPLAKEDPDITLSAEERQIGGLGIYMVKKSMDEVVYEYKDGQNILRIKKNLDIL